MTKPKNKRSSSPLSSPLPLPTTIGERSSLIQAGFGGPSDRDEPWYRFPTDVSEAERLLPRAHGEEKYVIQGEIARGGMGAILSAVDRDIRREVAMKIMIGEFEEEDRARFVEEAQITGQLEHPNIVPVHELGIDREGRLFFTMKRVRGQSLEEILAALREREPLAMRRFPLPVLLRAFIEVCHAIAFAHAKGVLHRDLKPANIMLGDFGEVLVMDWGLAKVMAAPERPRSTLLGERETPPAESAPFFANVTTFRKRVGWKTADGFVAGTPAYMSPEQARGEEIDPRSDVYALGAILYEILTLRPTVEGDSVEDIMQKVVNGTIPPPQPFHPDRPIPEELIAIALKALEYAPQNRYQSVHELRLDVERYLEEGGAFAGRGGRKEKGWRRLLASPARALLFLSLGLILLGALFFLLRESIRLQHIAEKERVFRIQAEREKEALRNQLEASPPQGDIAPPPTASTPSPWNLLFSDDFDRPELASEWEVVEGKASVQDGALYLEGAGPQYIVLRLPARGDVRVEFEGWQSEEPLCDLSCEFASSGRPFSGVLLQFGAYFNSRNQLLVEGREVVDLTSFPLIEAGKRHRIVAERRGDYFRLEVDGIVALDCCARLSEEIRSHDRIALYGFHGKHGFDSIRVFTRGLSSNASVSDLLPKLACEGYPQAAEMAYRLTAQSATSASEQVAALIAGMRLRAQGGDWEGAVRMLQDSRLTHRLEEDPWIESSRCFPRFQERDPFYQYHALHVILCRRLLLSSSLEHEKREETLDALLESLQALSELPRWGEILAAVTHEGWEVESLSLHAHEPLSLEWLRGLRLRRLDLSHTPVKSLQPLEGMPLRCLSLAWSGVENLSPLAGSSLLLLSLEGCPVKDLSPLRHLPLLDLSLAYSSVENLAPLSGMALSRLDLGSTSIVDLSPLETLHLRSLILDGTPISSLVPLQKLPLLHLSIGKTLVTDLSPLSGKSLFFLRLDQTKICDLRPLHNMPLAYLSLSGIPLDAEDYDVLSSLPLFSLTVDLTPGIGKNLIARIPSLTWLNGCRIPHVQRVLPDLERALAGEKVDLSRYAERVGKKRMLVLPLRLSWIEAEAFCQAQKARLPSPATNEEFEELLTYLAKTTDLSGSIHVDAEWDEKTQTPRWRSGAEWRWDGAIPMLRRELARYRKNQAEDHHEGERFTLGFDWRGRKWTSGPNQAIRTCILVWEAESRQKDP